MHYNIVVIGSGNVATHLSQALSSAGHSISQIYSRQIENAKSLASDFNCSYTDNISKIETNADLYIISISDKAIDEIVSKIEFEPQRVVHTAGSIDISILNRFTNHGVFYPLQSFSKNRTIDISEVPICIEASNSSLNGELTSIAKQLSEKIYHISSAQRKECHIAAVFANNFTNHLYNIAANMLSKKDIPFDIILPIIKETARKVEELHPATSQTGPAVRNDKNVINEHINMLKSNNLDKLYKTLSDSIAEYAKTQNNE